MKFFIFLSILVTFALAHSEGIEKTPSSFFIDTEKAYTLETIDSTKNDFYGDADSVPHYSGTPVWTLFSITNTTAKRQSLVLYNPLPIIRYLDILIKHQNGSIEKFYLGTNRPHNLSYSRFDGYALILNPHEKVEIYTRHFSVGLMNLHWNVLEINKFYANSALDNTLWGAFIGIIAILIGYCFTLFIYTREKSFLFYIAYVTLTLIVQLAFNGFISLYTYEAGIIIRNTLSLYPTLIILFGSFFLISLYDLKNFCPVFYKVFASFATGAVGFFIAFVFMYLTSPSLLLIEIYSAFGFLFILTAFFFSVYAFIKHWSGSLLLMIGLSLYTVSYFLFLTMLDDSIAVTYFMLSSIVAETALFALILKEKIESIQKEKRKAQNALLEHAKFLSIGKTLASVIHQLRRPIAHIGAVSTRVRTVFERHKLQLDDYEYASCEELERIVALADDTVSRFYTLYTNDKQKEHFDMREAVREIVLMLFPDTAQHGIEVTQELIFAPMLGYPNAIKHIVMIILENAIDILQERKIQSPQISIALSLDRTSYILKISDNGGGISMKPIEAIFEFYSSDKKNVGLGIGLALAKNLILSSSGSIDVLNTDAGTCFTLIVPSGI
jgi:two-component system, sensor histidine kinase LadS